MKVGLRLRVTLTLIAVVVPLTTAFSVYRGATERRSAFERRADRVAVRLGSRIEGRARRRACLGPQAYRRARRQGLDVAIYDASGDPQPPTSAVLDPALRQALAGATPGEPVHLWYWDRASSLGATAVTLEGSEACRTLVLRWSPRGAARSARVTRAVLTQALVLGLMLLLTGLILTLPLVYRIRKLTEAVERAPEEGWAMDVEVRSSDEVGALARAFERTGKIVAETIAELEERDQTLKQYISNTTHDLAIPLTVLQHRLRAIGRRMASGEEVDQGDVDAALEESHYIAALIANMSASAKLEAGQATLRRHEVALLELVERVCARHEPVAERRGIEVNFAGDPVTAWADSTLLEQALSNLVQNAIQYHDDPEGGHVSIVVEATQQGFSLRVLDDGPGVSPEFLEKMTERHARSDAARSRNPGGQGFGLSIATRVCERHGYTLAFENGPDGGLVATISGPTGASSPGV